WADGPAAGLDADSTDDEDRFDDEEDIDDDDVLDLVDEAEASAPDEVVRQRFGSLLDLAYSPARNDDSDDEQEDENHFPIGVGVLPVAAAVETAPPETGQSDMGLGDWLASAREFADEFRRGEERTRATLYKAIGRAYDFSLAAARDPEGFAELLADAGFGVQNRAPMTPVVKLVFGADYDKTRVTEYATALAHAHR